MRRPDIARRRLINQGLVKPAQKKASAVVAKLGAVQAQDYGASKWGIVQRTNGLTDAEIDREIDDGTIVRTHVLRPTWHFVHAADIGWILALTAPRVHAANAFWYRWLEVDDSLARRTRAILVKALRDHKHLTRAELGALLARAKVDVTNPIRVAGIMMRAELDGLICSGRRRGKQFTYALLEERVPKRTELDREAALAELARRYFTTRGPATVADFAWWSGLTRTDARKGAQAAAQDLREESIDDQSHWSAPNERQARLSAPLASLLPNYDEFFVGFKNRRAFGVRLESAGIKPTTSALSGHALAINGQIIGSWGKTLTNRGLIVEPKPRIRLSEAERRAVGAAVRKYGAFLECSATTKDF